MIVLRVGRDRGETHCVYTRKEAIARGIKPVPDWRLAHDGEWITTVEGGVMEVLRTGQAHNGRYVRTASGTFHTLGKREPTQVVQQDRYSFGGRARKQHLTKRAKLFVREYIARGDLEKAYRIAFPGARAPQYISGRIRSLLRMEEIQQFYVSEAQRTAEKYGFSLDGILSKAKDLYDKANNDKQRLALLRFARDTLFEAEENARKRNPAAGGMQPGIGQGSSESPRSLPEGSSQPGLVVLESDDAAALADHEKHRASGAIEADADMLLPEEVAQNNEARLGAGIAVHDAGGAGRGSSD